VDAALGLLSRGGARGLDLPGGLRVRRRNDTIQFLAGAEAPGRREGPPPAEAGAACREALCPVPGAVSLPDLGLRLTARLARPGEKVPPPGPERALLDADRVKGPLVVRPRRPGDRFVPQGGPGTRRLKSFLIDRKVPVDERGRIPLVLSGERIAWVVGHRIDDRFKITPATRRVLVLEKETR
jgi:tRNA(Ile)-lysidine synthase